VHQRREVGKETWSPKNDQTSDKATAILTARGRKAGKEVERTKPTSVGEKRNSKYNLGREKVK